MLPQKRILLITGVTDFLEIRLDGYERKKAGSFRASQLVEKTTFFLQAFLFYTVSLDIHQVSDAEKALPHA
ncbi:hypothetical protein SC09_contig4orf00889 [Bacillus subtilis]|uniref:Uncharacterized protein n=1 Tax=Bacillus subtilis TaxID=1423 RepID=A0A0D1KIG4_BACIU|nr:hypothetical protein SC09_contig4orf00889 [Bacillus subtilis]